MASETHQVWGFAIALASQLIVPSAFADDNFALGVQEFSIVCPSAIFEPNKLDSLLKQRGFAETDRDGDEDSEVASFTQGGTNLTLEFTGSPSGAPRKEIWGCKLYMERATQILQLDATFEYLMRDQRLSGMRKSLVKNVAGWTEIKADKQADDSCLSLHFLGINTSNQKTTELLLGRTDTPCKDSTQ